MIKPLILTLRMDTASFARLDALRRAHFPPERNFIPAHITLFHHLPGADEAAIVLHLRTVTAVQTPFPVAAKGVRFLGRGVAFDLASDELARLRADLAGAWRDHLTPQDRQPHRPHVTIQNKVEPAAARALHTQLAAEFSPFDIRAEGLCLWCYEGGPWSPVAQLPFGPA